jgi:hypothetical protein
VNVEQWWSDNWQGKTVAVDEETCGSLGLPYEWTQACATGSRRLIRLNCVPAAELRLGRGFVYLCLQVTLHVTLENAFGCEIWGVCRSVREVFVHVGYCAASVGGFVTSISGQHVSPINVSRDNLTLDYGTGAVSRNGGNESPTDAAQYARGVKYSVVSGYKFVDAEPRVLCWDKDARHHWEQSNACSPIRSQRHRLEWHWRVRVWPMIVLML